MANLRELQEDRSHALRKAREVLEQYDDDESMSAEDKAEHDRWMEDFADYTEQIEEVRDTQRRREQVAEAEDRLDERDHEPIAKRAFEGEGEGDGGYSMDEWRSAFTKYLRRGQSGISPEDRATLTNRVPGYEKRESDVIVGTSGQGGVLVPTEFDDRLFQEMKAFGGLQRAVEDAPGDPIPFPLVTDDGRDLDVPLMDDTANTASLVTEGSTIGSISNISLNDVTFSAHIYQSGPLAVSFEMMQDSAIEPETLVRTAIANRIGRAWAKDLIDSTAAAAPEGLVNASTGAVTVASGSSNLTFDLLFDLKHSVDPAHRDSAAWLFSDDTFKAISKITDSQGRYLLEDNLQTGPNERMTLLGKPFYIDNSSTAINFGSSNNKVVWFGNFGRFGIRQIRQTEVLTLNELFALKRKVGFVGFVRADSRIMQSTGLAAGQRPIRCILENT